MGSDFYKRTKELFEEFQKRELHYLNTESIYSDQFHITSDINLPVEEYLQKLNKREKESEDTYRGLMAHMEELDRRTESISAKLAKLDSLRSTMFLRFPTYSSSNNTFDQQYLNYSCPPNTFSTNQDFKYLSALKTNQDFEFPSTSQARQVKDLKCAVTQTDLMFCENCQFPITFSSSLSIDSRPVSTVPELSTPLLQSSSLYSSIKADSSLEFNSSTDLVNQNTSFSPNFTHQSASQTITQPSSSVHRNVLNPSKPGDSVYLNVLNASQLSDSVNQNVFNPGQPNDSVHQNVLNPGQLSDSVHQNVLKPSDSVHQNMLNPNKKEDLCFNPPVPEIPVLSSKEAEIDSQMSDKNLSKSSMSEKTNTEAVNICKTVTILTDDDGLVNERKPSIDDTISISDGLDKVISKSDNESLNHEFDFLDSDKRSQRRVLQTKQEPPTETSIHTIDNLTSTRETDQKDKKSNKDNLLQSGKKITETPIYDHKSSNETLDKQSESSISIEGAQSPSLQSENVSAVSDSDSLYEKEDPHAKTSAAYQALLGNVPIAKKVQQVPYSESDSEDEIEKALANTSKKNRKVSVNSASQVDEKMQDSKKGLPESKPKMEPRKSISGGKSQQLSRNTRKVLGLDTSSGSEGEVKMEANSKKKIEEDSDEFDFYD